MCEIEIELKPCPCCNGKAYFGRVKFSPNCEQAKLNCRTEGHFVNCSICGLTNCQGLSYATKEEAAEPWNKRTSGTGEKEKSVISEQKKNQTEETSEYILRQKAKVFLEKLADLMCEANFTEWDIDPKRRLLFALCRQICSGTDEEENSKAELRHKTRCKTLNGVIDYKDSVIANYRNAIKAIREMTARPVGGNPSRVDYIKVFCDWAEGKIKGKLEFTTAGPVIITEEENSAKSENQS